MRSRPWFVSAVALVALALALLGTACGDAADIVAPSGSNLTLTSAATSLPFNGTAALTVQIVDAQGRPVPDGTQVTFAATLGTVQPAEVATAGGAAAATFNAGVASGTATVTATSGSAGTSNSVRIAVGVAAVATVTVSATPPAVPFGGGHSVLAAVVADAGGNPLPGIPVTFTTTAGTLTPTDLKTDATGKVQTTLATSQAATVMATAKPAPSDSGATSVTPKSGSVAVTVAPQPQPVVAITPSANPVANAPTTFTISVAPAAGSNTTIRNVSISFGDGSQADLGAPTGAAILAQHVYTAGGSYTVTVRATDSGGGVGTASTIIVVTAAAPLSVTIALGASVPGGGNQSIVTLTATVQPPTAVIASYVWEFPAGSPPSTETTTSNQVQHLFTRNFSYTVRVTVTTVGGGLTGTGSAIIFVQ